MKNYHWAESPALDFWLWVQREDLEDQVYTLYNALQSRSQPGFDALEDVFMEEWEAMWHAGPTRQAFQAWLDTKHRDLEKLRLLSALAE